MELVINQEWFNIDEKYSLADVFTNKTFFPSYKWNKGEIKKLQKHGTLLRFNFFKRHN